MPCGNVLWWSRAYSAIWAVRSRLVLCARSDDGPAGAQRGRALLGGRVLSRGQLVSQPLHGGLLLRHAGPGCSLGSVHCWVLLRHRPNSMRSWDVLPQHGRLCCHRLLAVHCWVLLLGLRPQHRFRSVHSGLLLPRRPELAHSRELLVPDGLRVPCGGVAAHQMCLGYVPTAGGPGIVCDMSRWVLLQQRWCIDC